MSNESKFVPLKSLAHVITKGTTPTKEQGYTDDGINFIRALSIDKNGQLDEGTFLKISDETNADLKRSIVQEGDVLFTIAGVIGRVTVVEKKHLPANLNQALAIIRPKKDKISSRYLANLLRSHDAQFYLKSRVVESVQANLSLTELGRFPVEVLSLEMQNNRNKMLELIEDKISSELKTSDISETLISSLFRSWFIDFDPVKAKAAGKLPYGMDEETAALFSDSFEDSELGPIPTGWTVGIMEDVLSRKQDSTTPGKHLSKRCYVPIDNIDSKSLTLNKWQSYEDAASSLILFSKNDLLFGAMRPYFHKVAVAPFDGITRSTCFVFTPKVPETLGFSLCLLNLDSTIRYSTDSSLGSTMPYAIWENGLARLKIVLPPSQIMVAFSELISPLIEKIRDGGLSARSLSSTRDALLPRLMSGEISVS